MKYLYALIAAALTFGSASAQTLIGSWTGKLSAGPMTITVGINVLNEKEATLDSPDQGVKGIPAKVGYLDDDSLCVAIPMLGASFAASLSDGKLQGTFTQNGMALPLTLENKVEEIKRPQTPKPPFPYTTKEITFTNHTDSATLAGTLTVPKGKCDMVVLLVTGSGFQNRDEELFEHKPFAVIADALARQGIATLRYDDRSFGASTGGDIINATTANFALDAQAGIEWLRQQKKFKKVGILGHSEGATIAFMLGEKHLVDFIISLAGVGVKGEDALCAQANKILELNGSPMRLTVEQYRAQLQGKCNRWTTYFCDYDPTAALAAIQCPVLAVGGSNDVQVIASQNLPAIEKGLKPNAKNAFKEYPDLNHLFQPATTGMPNEYRQIETTISPVVLSDMVSWLKSL